MAVSDFNGDGRSDVLWISDAGEVGTWSGAPSGGFTVNHGAGAQVPTSWRSHAIADFNGDGRADVLWLDDSRTPVIWLARPDGSFLLSPAPSLSPVSADWTIQGTGDFNGDGRGDLLWRSRDGWLGTWSGTADGSFIINDGAALVHVPTYWSVSQTGDFDGDGRTDILWRDDTGTFGTWQATASGFAVDPDFAPRNLGVDWMPSHPFDYDGDGRDDLAWFGANGPTAGQNGFWTGKANGDFAIQPILPDSIDMDSPGNAYRIRVGDYNGDGRTDLIFREAETLTLRLASPSGGYLKDQPITFHVPTEWNTLPSPDGSPDWYAW